MLYRLLKPIVTLAVHIFYKRIEIENEHLLNQPGPTLIVANHSNAFLDAITIEIFAKRQLYAMARGDAFKSPLASAVLTNLHVIPIYRKGEAEEIAAKNAAAFETCMLLLENGEQVIMFPEGDCITEKRLRKLKKGAARIALRAEARNKFNLGVRVLPVGLNYSAAKNFRSNLFIKIGEPVLVKDFSAQFMADPVKTINAFTQHLEEKMRELVIDIQQHSNDRLYEDIVALHPQKHVKGPGQLAKDFFKNRTIAATINFFHTHHHERLKGLKHQLRHYHETLDKLKIPYRFFTWENVAQLGFVSSTKNIFLVGLGIPLHIVGIALNYLPYRLAYSIAGKSKQPQFYASINFAIGMFGWIAYYLIQLLLIATLVKNIWGTLIMALVIPISGLYSITFYSFMKKTYARWNLFSLQQNHPEVVDKLLTIRRELLDEIKLMTSTTAK